MIEFIKRTKRALELAVRIPLPDIRIALTDDEQETILNVPLKHNVVIEAQEEEEDVKGQ